MRIQTFEAIIETEIQCNFLNINVLIARAADQVWFLYKSSLKGVHNKSKTPSKILSTRKGRLIFDCHYLENAKLYIYRKK